MSHSARANSPTYMKINMNYLGIKNLITTASDIHLEDVMLPLCVDMHRVSSQTDALVHGTLE